MHDALHVKRVTQIEQEQEPPLLSLRQQLLAQAAAG